jgi:hypothetical protein
MYTTPPTLTAVRTPPSSRVEPDPWMLWRTDAPAEPDVLTVAELAECCCPDLCDRDHANE